MRRSIVVVDEQPAVVAAFAAALTEAGYPPSGANTFRDGVQLLLAVEPAVLVVSVELGAYNGLHLLLRSTTDVPTARVLVIGPANASIEHEALALGASAYLPRPVTPAALVEHVRACFLTTGHRLPTMLPVAAAAHA